MAKVIIRPWCVEDAHYIGPRLRWQDKLEMRETLGGDDIHRLICGALGSMDVYTAEREGRPICMFGVAAIDFSAGTGCWWCLGTDELFRIPGALNRGARAHIAEIAPIFPRLINWVHVDNTQSIRWLEHMGAVFDEPAPFGLNGSLFRRFELRADNVREH